MKLLKNFIGIFSLLFVLSIVGCNDDGIQSNIESEVSQLQLTSPNGFKIADNIKRLKDYVSLSENDVISSIEYNDGPNNTSLAIVYYESNGVLKNFALSNSPGTTNPNFSYKNNNESLDDGDVWLFECIGCEDCIIQSVIQNGTAVSTCSNECCSLKITKTTTIAP